MQSNLSVASIGKSEILTPPAASNRQIPVRSSSSALKKLEAELNEHRYYLEQKVEQRTEELVKRINLLESCNSTLCGKLAEAKKLIAALQKQIDGSTPVAKSNYCSGLTTIIGEETHHAESDSRLAA
jgi:glutamine amidotransferase PdxT